MIVGRGSLAKMLNDREGAIFFAAGVGNSLETDRAIFEREVLRLSEFKFDGRCLFYFSSIDCGLKNTPYLKHKLFMEHCVRSWFENYCIIRLGNIWGCTNPHTFINSLNAHPEYATRDEWKYMIHKEQLLLLTNNLPLVGRHEISAFGEMRKVKDCL